MGAPPGSGPSGPGSPPGGLSRRDSAKRRLGPGPQRLCDRFGPVCSGGTVGGPGPAACSPSANARVHTRPPSPPLFQPHRLPSCADLASPAPSLPPTLFLPSPAAVGRLLDVREGERSFGDDAVPPLKAFTSTAQVPVGTEVPSILPRRASLRPPWAGTLGKQVFYLKPKGCLTVPMIQRPWLGLPGGPLVKLPHSHCRGHGFQAWAEN